MKNIEVVTPQNVVIEYKLAQVFDRFLAWLIDTAIQIVGAIIVGSFVGIISGGSDNQALYYIFVAPIWLCYHLIMEVFNRGQSVGKMALGLRVVKINSEPVAIYDYMMRWVFRLIDIGVSAGLLAVLTIASSVRNQRIGDYLANTTVIRVSKTERFHLSRVMELDALKNYEVVYPEVKTLTESDLLLVKEVLDRKSKFQNNGHEEALNLLLKKIKQKLDLEPQPGNEINFLKTLIKDYVALTR